MKNQSKTKQTLVQKRASLDKASEYAENIINTVREPLIVLDQDLRVVTASRSFYEFFKVKPEETEGQLIYNLGNKQWDIPKLRELLEDILSQKTTFDDFEVEHDFTTIGKRIMLLNARQIKRALGKKHIILLAIEDVTERRLSEEKLLLAAIVESSKDAVIGKSIDGIITSWNKGAEEIYGYTKSEIIGKSISVLVPPEFPNELTNILRKVKLGEAIESYETLRQRKDGQNIYVSITVSAIYDDEGSILGASSLARDITERKRAEESLLESEQRLKEAQKVAHIGHWELDPKIGTPIWSDEIFRIFGLDPKDNEPSFVNHKTHLHPDDWPILDKAVTKASMDGTPFDIQFRIVQPSGEIKWMHALGTTIMDSNGVISKLFGTAQDITERKRAEEVLRESNEQYRLLADNVHDVIFVLDMNLKYTYVSPSVKILRGYEPEEVMKQSPSKTLTPSSWDLATKTLSEFMELEKTEHREINISPTLQLEMMRKDGTTVWTEVKFSVIRDENQQPVGILGVTRDITERKKAEEEIKQTLESLRKSVGTTIQVMVSAVEMRDPYTAGHQFRAATLACAIATEMGFSPDKIDGIRMAGCIHDIGKLSIPAEILSKPTRLTGIEFSLIKEHSRSGYEMLKDVESPWPLAQIVYQHHERMDGFGYPRNLKGDEILIEARIMAVADVVEAMASHRPYRPALGIEAALEEIEKNKRILYDNTVADACLKLFREKGYQLT